MITYKQKQPVYCIDSIVNHSVWIMGRDCNKNTVKRSPLS